MRKYLTISFVMTLAINNVFANQSNIDHFANNVFHNEGSSLQLRELSEQEMRETEGEIAPLVAVGLMVGGRFITQKIVTQTMAKNMVRSAGNNALRTGDNRIWGVMANSRSQARAIAGNSRIREFHSGSGARYTHYHTNPRNGSHVWYGKSR